VTLYFCLVILSDTNMYKHTSQTNPSRSNWPLKPERNLNKHLVTTHNTLLQSPKIQDTQKLHRSLAHQVDSNKHTHSTHMLENHEMNNSNK
jgi:hypothetical protein